MSRAEVKSLSSRENLLVIVSNSVYDLTEFIEIHPGGRRTIIKYMGIDASEMMHTRHPVKSNGTNVMSLLKQYKVASIIDEDIQKKD
mmetsp:Transcript_8782/g.7692  ORF Transcript_8782/g.7692 Transcript_8782/m.7692 type:complete len:87 (+) Transcript_8782:103-363(+)